MRDRTNREVKDLKTRTKNKEGDKEMPAIITIRILIAAIGGGLVFFGLNTIYNNINNLFTVNVVNILAVLVIILGIGLIYKGRHY